MAFGPLFPHSQVPATSGTTFPNVHVGAGANSKRDDGLGVAASIAADATWNLRFQMPPSSLPTGTLKLVVRCLANATSGVAKINPKWVAVAAGVSPSGATLVAEGVTPDAKAGQAGSTDTLEWGAGDNDQYVTATWTLNATTLPAAGEVLVMDLVFETSGWTLAQVLTVQPFVIFE